MTIKLLRPYILFKNKIKFVLIMIYKNTEHSYIRTFTLMIYRLRFDM